RTIADSMSAWCSGHFLLPMNVTNSSNALRAAAYGSTADGSCALFVMGSSWLVGLATSDLQEPDSIDKPTWAYIAQMEPHPFLVGPQPVPLAQSERENLRHTIGAREAELVLATFGRTLLRHELAQCLDPPLHRARATPPDHELALDLLPLR